MAKASPAFAPIEFDNAYLQSAKADLVKRKILLTIAIPLDDDTLLLRERLAFIAFDEKPVRVQITAKQLELGLS